MTKVEQSKLDEIKNRVLESRLTLRANERAGRDEYLASARKHLETLTTVAQELGVWSADLDNKAEQVKMKGKTTMPKPNDPYFKLHAQAVPYISDVRREKDELEGWLASQVN